jgi:hypothetical protein
MKKNVWHRIPLVLLLALALSGLGLGRTRRSEPVDLAVKSQHVSIVRCVDAQVVRHESGFFFTRFSFETVDTIRGKAAPAQFRLDIAGGTVGHMRLVIHDAPRFTAGKNYAVFLRAKRHSAGLLLTGSAQGVFPARQDPDSGQWMIALDGGRGAPKAAGAAPSKENDWISVDEFRFLLTPKGGGQ